MIIRVLVVDPRPRHTKDDTIVYQVPEGSRAHELLIEMLESQGIEYIDVKSLQKRRKK